MSTAGLFHQICNRLRVARLRGAGATIGENVSIGHHVKVSGAVTIADNVVLQDGVSLSGNIRIGKGCRIEKMAELSGNIELGPDTVVGGYTFLSTMPSGRISVGRDVLVNVFSVIGANVRVDIGDHSIFAPYVHITDSTHGIDNPDELIKHASWTSKPVFIDKNVWLGSNVMIAMGSTVGAGSVIGAKSFVNSDIPPMSVAYGTPAKVMRNRKATLT